MWRHASTMILLVLAAASCSNASVSDDEATQHGIDRLGFWHQVDTSNTTRALLGLERSERGFSSDEATIDKILSDPGHSTLRRPQNLLTQAERDLYLPETLESYIEDSVRVRFLNQPGKPDGLLQATTRLAGPFDLEVTLWVRDSSSFDPGDNEQIQRLSNYIIRESPGTWDELVEVITTLQADEKINVPNAKFDVAARPHGLVVLAREGNDWNDAKHVLGDAIDLVVEYRDPPRFSPRFQTGGEVIN